MSRSKGNQIWALGMCCWGCSTLMQLKELSRKMFEGLVWTNCPKSVHTLISLSHRKREQLAPRASSSKNTHFDFSTLGKSQVEQEGISPEMQGRLAWRSSQWSTCLLTTNCCQEAANLLWWLIQQAVQKWVHSSSKFKPYWVIISLVHNHEVYTLQICSTNHVLTLI